MTTMCLLPFVLSSRSALCFSSPVKWFNRELRDNPSFVLTVIRSSGCFDFRLTTWNRFDLLSISGSSLRFLLFPGRYLFHWVPGTTFGVMKLNIDTTEDLQGSCTQIGLVSLMVPVWLENSSVSKPWGNCRYLVGLIIWKHKRVPACIEWWHYYWKFFLKGRE